MADTIPISEFETELSRLLEMELSEAEDTLEDILSKRAKGCRDKLRQRSPKDTGEYAKGWRVKTAQRNHERVKVIYNANKPELTHILEYGTDRQRAQPHIQPALMETVEELVDELADRL